MNTSSELEFSKTSDIAAGDFTASMWKRFFAALIDQLILAFIFFLLQLIKLLHFDSKASFIDVAIGFGVLFFYQFAFLSLKSATPGKLIFHLSVVAAETRGRRPASDVRIIKRSILGPLLMMVAPLPYIFSFLRSDRRQLADLLSGTKVIAETKSSKDKRPILAVLLALNSALTVALLSMLVHNFLNRSAPADVSIEKKAEPVLASDPDENLATPDK